MNTRIRFHRDSIGRRRAFRYDPDLARWSLIRVAFADRLIQENQATVHPDSNAAPEPYKEKVVQKRHRAFGNRYVVCFATKDQTTIERTVRATSAKEAVEKVKKWHLGTRHQLATIKNIKEWTT